MWQTDYFAKCDKCGNIEYMDGRTKEAASKTAKEKGWSVSATKILCLQCKHSERCECGVAKDPAKYGKLHLHDCPAIRY